MDAVEFIKTRARICRAYEDCENCPLDFFCTEEYIEQDSDDFIDRVVKETKQWAKEHPVKTRQSEFLKMWPEVTVDKHGVCNLEPCNLCPSMLNSDGCSISNCDKCRRDFWLKEIE